MLHIFIYLLNLPLKLSHPYTPYHNVDIDVA